MKALTICQPFAHQIIAGEKRVENRTWRTHHRGPLIVHAGRNRAWMNGASDAGMAFGAVVGMVDVIDCVAWSDVTRGKHDVAYPWLRNHPHAFGPWCWVLERPTILAQVVFVPGRLGLYELDIDSVLVRQLIARHTADRVVT